MKGIQAFIVFILFYRLEIFKKCKFGKINIITVLAVSGVAELDKTK